MTNVYDAMNNRIGQTYGTNSVEYVINPNAKLPQVLEQIKNGVTTYYVYGMGLLYQVTETPSGEKTLTYHYDYRGSTIALTDDNGNVVDRFEYSLYATMTYRSGSDDTPFLFNGRYGVMTDPSGLLYMLNRYYNPYICRFLNPDPTGFKGGMNFYAYANGNPVSYLDPFGLSFWSVTGHFLEGAAIGAAITAAVIVAAPEIAAGGAAALVWAGVSEATATTVASATVTAGLWTGAAVGTVTTGADVIHNANAGNWNGVAFDAGSLTGGFIVGTTPGIVGESSGGRTLTDSLHELIGQPPSQAPDTWNLGDILSYENANRYRSDYPNPSVLNWMASGPTPFMSGYSATATSSGLTSGFNLLTGQTPVDWLGNTISSSSTGKPH